MNRKVPNDFDNGKINLFEKIDLPSSGDSGRAVAQKSAMDVLDAATAEETMAEKSGSHSCEHVEQFQDGRTEYGCRWPQGLDQTLQAVVDAVLSLDRVECFAAEERP